MCNEYTHMCIKCICVHTKYVLSTAVCVHCVHNIGYICGNPIVQKREQSESQYIVIHAHIYTCGMCAR